MQPYVRYYWTFKSHCLVEALTFPIGCPQIIFHKEAPLYVPELETCQPRLAVSGQVDFPAHLRGEGVTDMLVVVFWPHAMGAFLHLPVSLLRNREISGYDLEDGSLNELAARVGECGDDGACVDAVERWLLARLAGAGGTRAERNVRRVAATVRCLFARPETPVTELASVACWSKKQFERVFCATVGMNPKEYARIVRFQKAMKLLQQDSSNLCLAQIAYRCGYADQSHFIREFRQFSGHTPLSLLEVCRPYSDLFTSPL